MCNIFCSVCKEQIEDDDNVFEVRQGFVEHGEFTPEEIFYYHAECNPPNNQPNKDQ